MHGTETRLRAQREMFYFDTIALTLFCKDFDARQMSVGVLSLKPVEDGELLSNLPPTVRLDAQAAQVLMDDLWAAGLRPMDTGQTVDRAALVQFIFTAINPVLAERALRPIDQANASETSDEENNFAKIAAGIEPPMMDKGQNFSLRLQTLLGIGEKNPEAFQKLSPVSQEILKKRVASLEFQVKQEENKMIGRMGAAPALQQSSP